MRIVVSGTHASGKSSLISDFALRHPEFAVFPDPFELIDEVEDVPGASLFASQLRIAADRLTDDPNARSLIAERGPLDFLAYLIALSELSGRPLGKEYFERASLRTVEALRTVDLLVVLPLTENTPIHVGQDEYPELRIAMNDVLLDLISDSDLTGEHLTVAEITGTPEARLTAIETLTGKPATALDLRQGE